MKRTWAISKGGVWVQSLAGVSNAIIPSQTHGHETLSLSLSPSGGMFGNERWIAEALVLSFEERIGSASADDAFVENNEDGADDRT